MTIRAALESAKNDFLKKADGAQKAELMRQLIQKCDASAGSLSKYAEYSEITRLSDTKFKKYHPVENYTLPLEENGQQNYFDLRIGEVSYAFRELGGHHFAYICAIKSDGDEDIRDEPIIKFATRPNMTFILVIRTASLLSSNYLAESNE